MVEVGHQGQMPASLDHLFEEAQQILRIGIGHVSVRPEGQGLGPDPDVLHVLQARAQQRFDIVANQARRHGHRVAPGEEHVGHFRVTPQVFDQVVDLARLEPQALKVDELRPAEAEGAVGVARLALGGEEEHGLAVLMLHSLQLASVQFRNVPGHLSRRVGIHPHPDLLGQAADVLRVAPGPDQAGDSLELLGAQHVPMGKGEPEHRVIRDAVPVDQMVDHVVVDLEGKDAGDDLDREPVLGIQSLDLGKGLEIGPGVVSHRRVRFCGGDSGGLLHVGGMELLNRGE